jgi:Zn-dependent protease with chaperone function
LPGAPVPVFCRDAPAPAMSLVGVFRPVLLVTSPLVDVLTAEELGAAIAHECGHLGSRDNLKRLAMRATPDALSFTPASRRLEREWALAAEHAADARAARDEQGGLALASALVKVARLTPPAPAPALASPLVGGDALAARIERLMAETTARAMSLRARIAVAAGAAASLALLAVAYRPLLEAVHQASEIAVRVLP